MVNDNVRYGGAHVPVDLILADLAEQAGFDVQVIWTECLGLRGRHGSRRTSKAAPATIGTRTRRGIVKLPVAS